MILRMRLILATIKVRIRMHGRQRSRPQNLRGMKSLVSVYRKPGGNAHQRRIHWRRKWREGAAVVLMERTFITGNCVR
jgi:hypothetical protein